MTSLIARTEVLIRGTHNAWSLAEAGSPEGKLCSVHLEIQGDENRGFHLVMSPDGFFTTDRWHLTIKEAQEDARELFGVATDAWASEAHDEHS